MQNDVVVKIRSSKIKYRMKTRFFKALRKLTSKFLKLSALSILYIQCLRYLSSSQCDVSLKKMRILASDILEIIKSRPLAFWYNKISIIRFSFSRNSFLTDVAFSTFIFNVFFLLSHSYLCLQAVHSKLWVQINILLSFPQDSFEISLNSCKLRFRFLSPPPPHTHHHFLHVLYFKPFQHDARFKWKERLHRLVEL